MNRTKLVHEYEHNRAFQRKVSRIAISLLEMAKIVG